MAANGQSNLNGVDPSLVVPLRINGEEVITQTTYKVINPTTNKVAWESSSASTTDAIKAAETAQVAFPAWSKTKASTRRDILLKAAQVFSSRAVELLKYEKVETGGADGFSTWLADMTVEQLKDVAGRISSAVGHIPTYEQEGRSAMVVREPYGVILSISPWYGHDDEDPG